MAKLNIVGTGPGSPEHVTSAARKAVQDAQVVIGAERSLQLFQNDIHGEKLTLTAKNVDEALKFAAESARNGKNVALLSTGDPGFSGLLGSVLSRNLAKNIEVNVVPAVSSIQACAARLCMPWDNAVLFTFHDSVSNEKKDAFAKAVKAGSAVILLPDPKNFTPKDIASFLLSRGVSDEIRIAVCENITLSNERITYCTLKEAANKDFPPLCVMIINVSKRNNE